LNTTPWGASAGLRWTDDEDRLTADWLQHNGIEVGLEIAGQAVQTVARDRSFHPVREYLGALEWDKVPRLDQWLNIYLGVKQTAFAAAAGRCWLISAVARILNPGCQVDYCLVVEGNQGILKSSALRKLAVRDEWFTDDIAQLGTKDASLQTIGVWLIEMGELKGMHKAELEHVKAFITRRIERFRPPYGKRPITFPRQCVFAASTNDNEYLLDPTGGRRFWPIACTNVKLDFIARDRDQLWAEALHRFRADESWWLDTPELTQLAQSEQAERYEGDAWEEPISRWISDPTQRFDERGHPVAEMTSDASSVTIADILYHCIGKSPDKQIPADNARVSRILRTLGYTRFRPGSPAPGEPRPGGRRYRKLS
jgi:predicted P-loop ATPase